jgi:hypothetical protein
MKNVEHMIHRNQHAAILLAAMFAFAVPAFAAAETSATNMPAATDTSAAAQTAPYSDADKWQFEITPYLFAAGMNGKTGIGPVTSNVAMSFDDIRKNLDRGFMALFEARKGPWTYGLEGVYFKLKDEGARSWQGPLGSSSTGTLEATMTEQLYQLTAGYRVMDEHTEVDVLGAARYTQLDADLNLTVTTGPSLLPDGSNSIGGTENWWDPVIGARVLQPLSDAWTLVGYADIGGFGAGSRLTYQLLAGANWQFSKSVSAKAGYRYLYQDYENGSFVWDMKSSGYYLGAGFRF